MTIIFMIRKFFIILFISLLITVLCIGIFPVSSFPMTDPDDLLYHPLKFFPLKAQKVVMENGIILYVLEDHEIPIINVSIVIATGSVYDTIGKEGLAELTGEVMRTGGTASLTGSAIDDVLEYFACSLSISINRDLGFASLSVLKKDMDTGLKILADIFQHPAFEDDKLKLAKELKIEELRRIADDPQRLAFRKFNHQIYWNNPRGRLSSISSLERINREDLFQFYRSYFYPANIMISITGDIGKEEAINKMKKYFGSWHVQGTPKIRIPTPKKQKGAIYFLIKDIPQSIIIYGSMAPAKKDNDTYAFEVLDFVLGSGGFRSRMFHEIRSTRGLAYSTGSFYNAKNDYGIFGAYAITSAESTASVISIIRSIIKEATDGMLDKNELEWAKNSINNAFIFSFSTAHQIAVQQMMNEYEKLPEDYIETFKDKIMQVQAVDIKKVAESYLSLDNAVVLILGNENIYQLLKLELDNVQKVEATID